MSDPRFIEQQLVRIEQYLKQNEMWSSDAPPSEAMASEIPFAADTMTFEQWLQFTFLPQMYHYSEHYENVPINMAVAPMAQQMLGADHNKLVHLLLTLDNLSEIQHG